jgi:hypothetical protein
VTRDRKFIEFWLRRARKELAISGRMAELAAILQSQQEPSRDWHRDLLRLRQGEWEPSMDDLIRIDGLLSRPQKTTSPEPTLPSLFE